MAVVVPGRFTAQVETSFVVFMIGMRINKFSAVRKWIFIFKTMGPMLRFLHQHPEQGLLETRFFFNLRGVTLIQYWRSFDDLEQFARNEAAPHLSVWRHFNKALSADSSVGIWHETYLVDAGKQETLYVNMPVCGLAAATQLVPAVGRRETARRRLGGVGHPTVTLPECSEGKASGRNG